jgi:hypothetical protein
MEDKKMLELTQEELKEFYIKNNIYICQYKTIYQIYYSQAQQKYYFEKIRHYDEPLSQHGRFYAINAKTLNSWVGFEIVNA